MAEELQASVTEEGAGRDRSRVGALLRAAREGKGRDLTSVSQQLRIRAVYLRAIEDGDFGALPGTTYAVGFVRSYADYLGLNGPDIVRRFREEVEELGRRTQLVFPSTPAEGKIPGGAILLLAVIIATIAYGAWFYMSDRDRSLAGLVPEVPAELKAVLNGNSQAATTIGAAPANAPSAATATAAAPSDAAATNPPPASSEAPAASTEAPPASIDGSRAETTAGVATAADERAVETINLAPAPSADTAGTAEEEDQAPAAPDNADAATRAATEGMAPTGETPAQTPPSMEGASAATAPVAATTSAAATATASAATSGAATAGTSPTGTQQAAMQTPPAPPAAPMPPEESLPKGQDYGVANGETRVVLVARQESWVQVSSANQEVWTRVLRPGDRYLVPNDPTLTLSTGNAGGLDILVDGRKIPSLGPVGVVRRGISLDPKRLLNGTAIP
jgi:cytoskeleton protein RodZ